MKTIMIMKKKEYIFPHVEVLSLGTRVLRVGGEASAPPDNFYSAPKRPVPMTLSNDSVRVF